MGNKQRKLKRKAATTKLPKTGGIPPVTLAVADPVTAFIQSIPTGADSSPITLKKALERIVKDVAKNRPRKGPLKKINLRPKVVILHQLSMRKDGEGRLVIDVLPGDPIAHLNGKPFVRSKMMSEDKGLEGEIPHNL